MSEYIIGLFVNMPRELATFLIAIIPVTELRVSIPLAVKGYGMTPFASWLYSVAGTYLVMIIIVLLLDPIVKTLSKHVPIFEKFFHWLFERTRKHASKKVEKYDEWAIFILAATPIPLLGGLIGALAAFVFNIPLKKSLPLLLAGTMVAGGIVLAVTMYF